MPKMKTKRAAAKRFKKTGTGKVKRNHAFKSHLLGGKTAKRKRHLRKDAVMHSGDVKRIKQLITYM
ncbi:50S ribosomal protein L35 [Laceyella sacchari]|jgi:large subunit ribosomal protein L35|uniref:Large ribosomal subunit protein bL35 n=3 Tax=Laceyella TaxID=292635 RepID=A0AA46ADF2_9BACL|nr:MULTISPECIES: 50S ribosomal protein L35 [Laceyella]KPC73772.1 50S ribosomal protein L35 [Thermoactinomyces vulgaris]AUS08255.1 50S ribosomal protein L35 [Laceyella sacchari]MRG26884.1 50S ribosomal protein L35 [Laceyella tengchongensis]PRZ16024.1 LSU ribosomal protein L35P [Laceyella sediminis]TCW40889.1 LSU ribosomal protein L35P [Laceyella sacchari]